jgi:chemotaxis protein CheX
MPIDPTSNYRELARKYGFAPTPESVARLTQLVARQDADVDEIAKAINKDPALRARLLRVANPHSDSESTYDVETVEEALMRNGIGCALLLAMGTPLGLALTKTFQTMLGKKLANIELHTVPPLEGSHVVGTIGFSGKAAGRVFLRMSSDSARQIAAGILGLAVEELTSTSEINDVIGEVLNIMTGNFKSNLCDAGLDCRLTPPEVKRTDDLSTPTVPGGGVERMAFQSESICLFVDVTVNPWSDD